MQRGRTQRGDAEKVLVLGEDTRSALGIARSLGRRNILVDTGWCHADSIALRSRYVHCSHCVSPPAVSWDASVSALREILDANDFDLVIPATDAAVIALQRLRRELQEHARLALPSDDSLEVAFDKLKTTRLAESLGIPIPPGWTLADAAQLDELRSEIQFPAIVKPLCSANGDDLFRKRFVRRANTYDELRAHVSYLLRESEQIIVQERVPGRGVGVNLLADRGEVLFAFQHTRLHETIGYGGTYRKSVPLDSELLSAATRLIDALDYTGVAMVEFRVDIGTGAWRLLEVNGRFWGSLPLAVAAGADFPYYLFQLLVHGQRNFPSRYRVGVHCRSLMGDVRWWWRRISNKPQRELKDVEELGWAIDKAPLRLLIGDIARALTLRDHVDSFAWDDPQPAFAETVQTLGLFRQQVGRRSVRHPNVLAEESCSRDQAVEPARTR